MRKNKTKSKTCQRSEKPDELAMVLLKNKEFGKRFISEFRKVQEGLACQQQKY